MCGDSISRIVSNLNINEVSEFHVECVDPKELCIFRRERERTWLADTTYWTGIRESTGGKCCRKADYGALNTSFG